MRRIFEARGIEHERLIRAPAQVAERILLHTETPMTRSSRIDVNPEVMLGKPVIRGTRITVELLLRKLSEGATEEDLLDAYPHITREDIKAAIAYSTT